MTVGVEVLSYLDANFGTNNLLPGHAETELLRALVDNEPSIMTVGMRHVILTGPPVTETEADVYNLTHTVMFGTDFGKQTVTLHEALQQSWTDKLQALDVQYADNTDIRGEILICTRLLNLWGTWADTALVAYRSQYNALSRDSSMFVQNYHPILVGGILFTLLGE